MAETVYHLRSLVICPIKERMLDKLIENEDLNLHWLRLKEEFFFEQKKEIQGIR